MAWTATIVQKGVVDKSFQVAVSYSNGTIQFVETTDMTGGTLQNLSDRVAARLANLEVTQLLIPQVTTGPFVPTPAALTTPLQNFAAALHALRNAQEMVDLGVIGINDASYLTAKNNAITAFDPSFVGQF